MKSYIIAFYLGGMLGGLSALIQCIKTASNTGIIVCSAIIILLDLLIFWEALNTKFKR